MSAHSSTPSRSSRFSRCTSARTFRRAHSFESISSLPESRSRSHAKKVLAGRASQRHSTDLRGLVHQLGFPSEVTATDLARRLRVALEENELLKHDKRVLSEALRGGVAA